jgi:carbon monoxide dehydrogenase subunit G
MNGARNVAADLDATWAALNDSAVLKECIPGCELIEATAPTKYRVTMASRIGPVSAKFCGQISLSDIEPPVSYKITFEGQGGAAGFVNGSARVGLVAEGATTRVDYMVTAQVGGKLAQIGSRLIDAAATKVSNDFFARFAEHLAKRDEVNEVPAPPAASAASAASAARTNPAAMDSQAPRRGAWGLIAIGVAACLFAYIAWKLSPAS